MTTTVNNTTNTAVDAKQAEYNFYLMEAPIAEFAKFAGIELDDAVSRRIDAARQIVDLSQVNVNVRLLNQPQGKMIGLAAVEYHGFKMDNFKVFNGKDGLFLGEPTIRDGKTNNFVKTIRVSGDDLRNALNQKAFEGYHAAVEKLQTRAADAKSMEIKPRIADQMANGARQAAAHNVALPPQGKGSRTQNADRGG